jgi:signal transduction histidine kinase
MPGDRQIQRLIGELAGREGRLETGVRLAAALGCDGMSVYVRGGPGGASRAAPGMADLLAGAAAADAFLAACEQKLEHRQVLHTDGGAMEARGIGTADGVFVVTGPGSGRADLDEVRPLLPLVHGLLVAEQRAAAPSTPSTPSQRLHDRLETGATVERRAAEAVAEAKAEFLAMMSHELRTPLNSVIGYTELLGLGVSGELNAEQIGHLDRVRAGSQHLLSLINDILDLARIEAGHMTVAHAPADGAQVVEAAVALLDGPARERGVRLEVACAGELPFVGDLERARQVVSHMLSNALKFSRPGDVARVHCAGGQQPDPGVRLPGGGPWTRIAVTDTGVGMSPAELAAVFKPFVQGQRGTRRVHGGTGLGLTISRQLARLMGGDVTAVSEPGTGSTFTLWLPSHAAGDGLLDDSIRVRAH